MLDLERLQKISELDGAKIGQLEESDLNSFAVKVNAFIDGFPAQEEKVKSALRSKDRDVLAKSLAAVCDMMRQIYADKLAESCESQLNTVGDTQYEDLQTFIIGLLKAVSALSIDLQMAGYQNIQKPDDAQESEVKNTILAVDDRHFFLTSIKQMLHDTGYKATCINSGASALNYLKNHNPDLFIFDIEMPEIDGYELARRVRAAGHTAPIIFLTGNAKKDSVVKALQAGAADFIVKPVTKSQLLERIGKYIKPEEPEEELPQDELVDDE